MTEIDQLEQTMAALEGQRALLGDVVVDAARAGLSQRLAALRSLPSPAKKEVSGEAGERKLVTVMFADISGFTALSEKMDPEAVRNLVNACFERLVPIIEKYGGTVDKFIGDEIMALFGAPVANENDPERALRAALEMVEILDRFNAEHASDLGLHFGINTGLVLAGDIGSQGRRQYSVMGDAVNLASRLGDASERRQIFVGADTHRLTGGLFEFDPLPPMKLKGKAEPVPAWRLMGPKQLPAARRGIEGLRSPLVGRERELGLIQSALRALQSGKGNVIAIQAEAGLGKSRLVTEARQGLTEGLTWVEGRCLSYTEGSSYWIARDTLCGLLGVKSDSPSSELASALHREMARLGGNRLEEMYPLLARFLEIPLGTSQMERIKDLTAEALRRGMVETYREYVRLRATEKPLVLVWEDLHWADPSSLNLLQTLLPLTREVPMLVLLVFRPEEGPMLGWHRQQEADASEQYQIIELVPLSHAESGQLAQSLLRIENLPGETRDLILQKAEGNPFFLEELLRSLIDAGFVMLRAEGAVAARPVRDLDVPDTLQGVIASRIDHLPPEHKLTLQTASVIGRMFQERVLALLLDRESSNVELDQALTGLRRREFVRLRAPEATGGIGTALDSEYIFKHVLTQAVTYNSLLIARRRTLHQLTGEAIETLFPTALDELSATLAYHFERAESREKAIYYLVRAATRAKAIYANAEAIAFYRSALAQVYPLLEAAGEEREKWQEKASHLNEELGDVLALVARYDEALGAYNEVLGRVPKEDAIWRARIHRRIARVFQPQRRYADSLKELQNGESSLQETRAESSGEWWQEWLDIQLEMMFVHYWRGEVAEMGELAQKAKPVLEKHGKVPQQRRFFRGVILLGLRRDRYVVLPETLAYAKALLDVLEQKKDTGEISEIAMERFLVGFTQFWTNDLSEAEAQLGVALNLAERTGNVEIQSRCLNYLTLLYRRSCQIETTQTFNERNMAMAKAGQLLEYVGMAKANQAWLAWRRQDASETKRLGEEALAILQQVAQGLMFRWTALWPLLAAVLALRLDSEAIDHARVLLDAKQNPPPPAIAPVLAQAIANWDSGHPELARKDLQRAVELATPLGYV